MAHLSFLVIYLWQKCWSFRLRYFLGTRGLSKIVRLNILNCSLYDWLWLITQAAPAWPLQRWCIFWLFLHASQYSLFIFKLWITLTPLKNGTWEIFPVCVFTARKSGTKEMLEGPLHICLNARCVASIALPYRPDILRVASRSGKLMHLRLCIGGLEFYKGNRWHNDWFKQSHWLFTYELAVSEHVLWNDKQWYSWFRWINK